MNFETVRQVRIHLAINSVAITESIRAVMPLVINELRFTYVENVTEADLIIFTEETDVKEEYDKEKTYAYLKVGKNKPSLPADCLIINATAVLPGLTKAAAEACKKIGPNAEEEPLTSIKKSVPGRAQRILVVDDTPKHVHSALSGISGHLLTTANGYEEAMNRLTSEIYDIVLTDLYLPMSPKGREDKLKPGVPVPCGFLLMVEAARLGAKYVAVVTDHSRFDDPLSAAFDNFSRSSVKIEGAKVIMMHARINQLDGSKDWAATLERLLKN